MTEGSRPRCSIVIRCHNEERHIGRLLAGIAEQTLAEHEIIVVDSGSTDSTVEIAARHGAMVLTISPEQFSFGRSLNVGCAAARGDIIVLASAHVYPVHRDWLGRLLSPFTDPATALTYGRQQGNEQTKYSERRVFAKWFPAHGNRDQAHPFCNNANAAIRRSVWVSEGYDESLTGLEDIDWARRVTAQGLRVVYVPDAVVVHVHNESPRRIYNRYLREAIALKQIFPHEHLSFSEFLALFGGNVSSDCYHAFHDGMLLRSLPGILSFRLMQFWGTYRGFAQRGPVTSELKHRFYYPSEKTRDGRRADAERVAIEYVSAPKGPRVGSSY